MINTKQDKNKDNCVNNISQVNNIENNKFQHNLRNNSNNYANVSNKYDRFSNCYNKNNKSKYYESSYPSDNIRLTRKLLDDMDKRNQDLDEDSDNQNFLTFVKKIIEEKKTEKNKSKSATNANVDISNNIETYQTINNNSSIYSDESTRVFVNKKHNVKMNMCNNPCDIWYGLKRQNGKSIFINSISNKNKKQRIKKSKHTEKFFINKKVKNTKWNYKYHMKLNNIDDSMSVNTIDTMHIDGNYKYNSEKGHNFLKNNLYNHHSISCGNVDRNIDGANHVNNHGANYGNHNYKHYYKKNFVNSTLDKNNKNDTNKDQIIKKANKKKNKNKLIWSNNNYVNINSTHYSIATKNRNNYFDNKTSYFNNFVKVYNKSSVACGSKNIFDESVKPKGSSSIVNYDSVHSVGNGDNDDNISNENKNNSVVHHNDNETSDINQNNNCIIYSSEVNYQNNAIEAYEKDINNISNHNNNSCINSLENCNKNDEKDKYFLNSTIINSLPDKKCYKVTNQEYKENITESNKSCAYSAFRSKKNFYEIKKSSIDIMNTHKNLIYPDNKSILNKPGAIKHKLNTCNHLNNLVMDDIKDDISYSSHSLLDNHESSCHNYVNDCCIKSKSNENVNNVEPHNVHNICNNKNNFCEKGIKDNKTINLHMIDDNSLYNIKVLENLNEDDLLHSKENVASNKINITNKDINVIINEDVINRNTIDILKSNSYSSNEVAHSNRKTHSYNDNHHSSKSYNANKINIDENLANIEEKDKLQFNYYQYENDKKNKYINYYNNLKFDFRHKSDKKKRSKKKWNVFYSHKSFYKNARE